ncbi:MAG: acyltransferase [Lachnospiraceae bacterium]|nr:acyltransferase [Lachnospiraceae bacterium]
MSSGWRWVVTDNRQCRRAQVNMSAKYPVNAGCIIGGNPDNIHFSPDELNNFQGTGCYFQVFGNITIGKGVYIACNVGIITANHKTSDLDSHEDAKNVIIGDYSWIGMNSVILPGVILGPHTIVGAGSVVTHSFIEGNCVVAGNPAKIVRKL